jgi:hypothetical protein
MHNDVEWSIPGYFQDDWHHCQKQNLVLDRKDNLGTGHKAERPYSVTNLTFANNLNGQECSSLNATLLAIQNGSRRWMNASHQTLPPLEQEEFPSYFVPSRCDLPYLSAPQLCAVLNKFSHIITIGDSLTRHFRQALFIALKRDLVLGGIESTVKSGPNNPYQCRCDGQFSEHKICRQNNGFFTSMMPRDLELCSHLPEGEAFQFSDRAHWDQMDCSNPKYKGAVFMLQGGVHFKTNASMTLAKLVDPILNHPTFQKCLQLNKIRVVWVSYGAQSRQLDEKYPLQTRENAKKFNLMMEQELLMKRSRANISIIDWWTLTAEAQTSDGFHFLTDINLVKVNHFVHVIKYLI